MKEVTAMPRYLKIVPMALAVAFASTLVACKKEPPPEPPKLRYQYTPEDFGVGRAHTKNAACNKEIDRLIEEFRVCHNTPSATNCDALQADNSKEIMRIKNSVYCSK